MDARLSSALAAGKIAALLSRRLGAGGGTSLPGELANRIDPAALPKLAGHLAHGCLLVTGTNGKTTTSRILSDILVAAGWHPIHNRAGANLLSGVTSALVNRSDLHGAVPADSGLFEVDEAVMPAAVERLQPRAVLITNLFRDQLDRYGEIDYLAGLWRNALASLPLTATVILNADDPLVASLGEDLAARTVFYGVEDEDLKVAQLEHASDSTTCPHCGSPLGYSAIYYSHIGRYRCPCCGHSRPQAAVAARRVTLEGASGCSINLMLGNEATDMQFRLPGLYNVYNVLAAAATAFALSAPSSAIRAGAEHFDAAFGRIERIPVEGKTVFLALVKNPIGFNQVLRTLFGNGASDQSSAGPRNAMILINDNFADGTDISWLWDVDFEILHDKLDFVVTGGTRAEDMMVRLKYAGIDSRVLLAKEMEAALRLGLNLTPPKGTLCVLPTYTAMLGVRQTLSNWGFTDKFWEN